MILGLVVLGIVVVLGGMIYATDRVDRYWSRGKVVQRREIPPFIWSDTQCRECGKDGELLSLEKLCVYCHERVHSG